MFGKLMNELNDCVIVVDEIGYLFDMFFVWMLLFVDVVGVNMIVVFGFGSCVGLLVVVLLLGFVNEVIVDVVF